MQRVMTTSRPARPRILRRSIRRLGPVWLAITALAAVAAISGFLLSQEPALRWPVALVWVPVPFIAWPVSRARGALALANPWFFILFLYLYGWAGRLTMAAIASAPAARQNLLTDQPPSSLYPALAYGFASLAVFGLGYHVAMRWRRLHPKPPRTGAIAESWRSYAARVNDVPAWSTRRVLLVTLAVLAVAAFGVAMLIGTDPDSLLGKRFNTIEGGSANRVTTIAYAWLRLSYLAHAALIPLLVWRLRSPRARAWQYTALVVLAAAAAGIGPLTGNSRAGVALIVLDVVVISSALVRKLPVVRMIVLLIATGAGMGWMLSVRSKRVGFLDSFGQMLIGRDLFDIGKTAHILALQPGVLNGQTLWGWLVFPFPQSALPFPKPMFTALGQWVYHNAYGGTTLSGVPAGLIGELWLNIGPIGVIVGFLLLGLVVGWMYGALRGGIQARQPLPVILFAVGLSRFLMFALSNDLGTGILDSLSTVLPVLFVLWLIVVGTRPRRPRSVIASEHAKSLRDKEPQSSPAPA